MKTPEEKKHSPLPWRINQNASFEDVIVRGGKGNTEAILNCSGNELFSNIVPRKTAEANAAYIVQACNAFPKLIHALNNLLVSAESGDFETLENGCQSARNLLAEIEGGEGE